MKVLLLISFTIAVSADFFHTHGPATLVQLKQHDLPSLYSFSYDGSSSGGGFHMETGDASGAKTGSYGIKGIDGRVRTVNYIADAGGFRATVDTNEPGVEGKNSADVTVTTSGRYVPSAVSAGAGDGAGFGGGAAVFGDGGGAPTPYNFAYGDAASGGPWQQESGDSSGYKSGSYGLRDEEGRTRTVSYVADAGGFRASVSSNEPGVEDRSSADATFSTAPGSAAFLAASSGPQILPAPAGPQRTGYGTIDASGAYSFAYGDTAGGPWQRESGDPSGSKSGSYGLRDDDGRVRTVNYVADGGGFRASVSSNEPGVEGDSPADAAFSKSAEPTFPASSGQFPGDPSAPQSYGPLGSGRTAPSGPISTGFGTTDASGRYSFSYGDSASGPWQRESGDAANKMGSYGLTDPDGHSRSVSYIADAGGFRASISSNEPGVGNESPADVMVMKRREPSSAPYGAPPTLAGAGSANAGGGGFTSRTAGGGYSFSYGDVSSGPWQKESGDASGSKSGSYGLKDIDGRVRSVNYVADAGGFRASISSNEPGVESKSPADVAISTALVPVGESVSAFGASPSHGPQSVSAPYSFGYVRSQGGGTSFHKESGDASGSKMGSYGIKGADGHIRTVHYVADAGGFRASISSNEPGVDSSKNPADTSISQAEGAVAVSHSALTASSHGTDHHKVAFVAPVIPVAIVQPGGFYYKTDVAHWDFGKARRL